MRLQSTDKILMIRPARFGFNDQTASSNAFQSRIQEDHALLNKKAQKEFDEMVEALIAHQIQVEVYQDTDNPIKPDAIFPNNWLAMMPQNQIVTFPMKTPNRQAEYREDIVQDLIEKYPNSTYLSLTDLQHQDIALEGTGSMVLDHINQRAYACLSPRTDIDAFIDFANQINYTPIYFHAFLENTLIYHTNVMMAIGTGYAVINLSCIRDPKEQNFVQDYLLKDKLDLIEISDTQMQQFAGNMLELSVKDKRYIVMSRTAYQSLKPHQIDTITKHASILSFSIDTIEKIGGGSVRCMIAENFLT
ncbi:MAG: arginine deiminase-related protein [Chitinophagales bacterium]|jgi:hypothetical protein|nr:arginine deiminase-related protein [Chitinophagales bacterium]